MFIYFKNISEKIRDSLNKNIGGPNAKKWLFGIAFAESSFFPIPPDLYLMPVVAKNRIKWWSYAFITTIASVLGGLFGYFIGWALFETIGKALVSLYSLQDELVLVGKFFNENAFLSIFTAAFTPIPYKVFTIAAGLFNLNLFVFIIASILGRGLRFFIVAFFMKLFGQKIGELAFKYFNIGSGALAVLIVLFVLYKIFF